MIWFLSAMEDNAEREKIEILYTTYKTWMWYLANSVLRDPQLAEDAVQEAFIALMRHLHKIEDPFEASTKSFLATIVKNKAIDILRKRQKTEEPIEEIPETNGEYSEAWHLGFDQGYMDGMSEVEYNDDPTGITDESGESDYMAGYEAGYITANYNR